MWHVVVISTMVLKNLVHYGHSGYEEMVHTLPWVLPVCFLYAGNNIGVLFWTFPSINRLNSVEETKIVDVQIG